jgi:hypothetical protein
MFSLISKILYSVLAKLKIKEQKYSLCSIIIVVVLVQIWTTIMTRIMERRDYYIFLPILPNLSRVFRSPLTHVALMTIVMHSSCLLGMAAVHELSIS